MSGILTLLFFFLFVGGVFNARILAIAVPIFTFVYPKNLDTLSMGDANLSMVFLLFCGVKYLWVRRRNFSSDVKAWHKAVLLYFGIVYIGTQVFSLLFISFSEYANAFKSIIDGFLCLFATMTMIMLLSDSDKKKYLLIGIVLAVIFEAIVAVGLMYDFNSFSMFYSGKALKSIGDYHRATGTFNGPWALGGFLSISILLLFYMFSSMQFNKITKILMMTCAVVALYALVLTESRASWLLLLVALIYLFMRGNTAIIKSTIWCLIIALIAVNYWLDWEEISFLIYHRVEYSYNNSVTGGIDESTMERIMIWEKVVNNYNPIFLITGYGIRNAYNVFGSTTHNTYLSLFIYCGLIGYFVIFKMIQIAKQLLCSCTKNVRHFITALFVGICAYGLTADILFDTRVFTLALCAFSVFILSDKRQLKSVVK